MIAIIGGTSGIGLATANYLQSKGENVLVCGRNKVEEDVNYAYIDVTDEASVKALLETAHDINALIYSTGITTRQTPITQFSTETWDNLVSVNITGLMLCLKYSYPHLAKNKGRIAVVNSFAARTYSMFSGVEYTMTKSALSGLVRQLSIQFAKDNVIINSVFPSMTATPMLIQNADKSLLETVTESIPLKRLATPAEVAKAIAFLISDDNTYMTGCGIDLNGGQFVNG